MRSFPCWLLWALASGCGDASQSVGGAGGGGDEPAGGGGAGAAGGDGGGGGGGGAPGDRPHPLYPALDLADLPGDGGAVSGPYTPPTLPVTSRRVTATTGAELMSACATAGTSVDVPSSAGNIGVVNFGNVDDCDVTLGPDVVIEFLVVGSLVGPVHAPSHRVRLRGGQIGSMIGVGGSTDIVLDGVAINNGAVPSANRSGTAIYLPEGESPGEVVDRFAVVNSFIRLVAVSAGSDLDGTAYLGGNVRNLFFANNNIVTAGNRNSWAFRLSGGDNTILIDNTVRVSFHKLVRMNDAPVDYVYIKGGTWMREATLTSGGLLLNDSFAQLSGSTTDRVFIHDPTVFLLPDTGVSFGAANDPMQSGRSWEARGIAWHARNDAVVSDSQLQAAQDFCTAVGGLCDYGVGTHSYSYDPALSFPTDPWRDLPSFDDDDPDNLPVLP